MPEWRRAGGYPSDKRLPPARFSTLLKEKDSRTYIPERIDMCYDEHGIVDIGATIIRLARTFDPTYTPGERTNSHHSIYHERREVVMSSPHHKNLREHLTMLGHVPVQIHNMFHEGCHIPQLPDESVSRACVKELGRSAHLLTLARGMHSRQQRLLNLWQRQRILPRPTWRQMTDEASVLSGEIRRLRGEYEGYLDGCPDPQASRMPSREVLASVAVADVITLLEPFVVTDRNGVDFRDFTVQAIRQYGGVPEPEPQFVQSA